jgi:hypothetical protein
MHTFSDEGEDDILIPDIEFIASLPNSVKAIIAHYSTLLPDHFWKDDVYSDFVAALGDFSSLKQAQDKLLKQYNINKLQTAFFKGIPVGLELKQTNDAIFFICTRGWQDSVVDEFRISSDGTITYIENAEPVSSIRYDRERLCEYYYDTHTIKLNGNKIDFLHTYLDEENIESVNVNERDKIIYIVQKNKDPEYFSPSEIDVSQLSISVKSIDEVTLLIREDGFGKTTIYDKERTRIERSAIRMIVNDLVSTDGKKYMDIVLIF